MSWIRRRLRALWCVIVHGHHEYYVARVPGWIFQQCVVCGHTTKGWHVSTTRTGKR